MPTPSSTTVIIVLPVTFCIDLDLPFSVKLMAFVKDYKVKYINGQVLVQFHILWYIIVQCSFFCLAARLDNANYIMATSCTFVLLLMGGGFHSGILSSLNIGAKLVQLTPVMCYFFRCVILVAPASPFFSMGFTMDLKFQWRNYIMTDNWYQSCFNSIIFWVLHFWCSFCFSDPCCSQFILANDVLAVTFLQSGKQALLLQLPPANKTTID